MKKLIIPIFLISSSLFAADSFESYKKQQSQTINNYQTSQVKEFKAFVAQQDSSFIQYKDDIKNLWNEFVESTNKDWVSYTGDFKTRGKVDFKSGVVEIATSQDKNVTQKEVKTTIANQLLSMLNEKDETGKSILSDQLVLQNKKTNEQKNDFSDKLYKEIKANKKKDLKSEITNFLNKEQFSISTPIKKEQVARISEKLVKKIQKQSKAEAKKTIKKTINKLEEAQASIQAAITPQNVHKVAEEISQNIKKETISTPDGSKKNIYKINFSLAPNHVQKRVKKYQPTIEKYCKKYKVDPAVALAIIHTESYFNPKAYNRHGNAYGMMQIVPKYAGKTMNSYLYGKNSLPKSRQLFNPETNLEMGIAYIGWLRDKKWNKVTNRTNQYYAIICSYNGGPGSVYKAMTGKMRKIGQKKWDKMMSDLSTMDEKKLHKKLRKDIPWEETRKYINTVNDKMISVYGYEI